MTDDEILKRADEIRDRKEKEERFARFDKQEFVSIATARNLRDHLGRRDSVQVWVEVPKDAVRSLVRRYMLEEG